MKTSLTNRREKRRKNTTFDLVAAVRESEENHLRPDIPPAHRFSISLEPSTFTKEKYNLFHAYQKRVHHETDDEITPSGFRRFLCSSPLHTTHASPSSPLGSYHHTYRLDGRLIAMGVLDLLPHALSAVYFLYHPDFEPWSLGKLSALREVVLARELRRPWYYMGYYIPSCPKMRYKAEYRPQLVLDLDTHVWLPLDNPVRAAMARRQWVSPSREARIAARIAASAAPDPDDPHSPDDAEQRDRLAAAEVYGPVRYPQPRDAAAANESILDLGMPGVPSREAVQSQIDLDAMTFTLNQVGTHKMRDIKTWAKGSLADPRSIRGLVAELAGCVGPQVAAEAVVDFSR